MWLLQRHICSNLAVSTKISQNERPRIPSSYEVVYKLNIFLASALGFVLYSSSDFTALYLLLNVMKTDSIST